MLRFLKSAGAALHQSLIAVVLLLGEDEIGLGLCDLRLGFFHIRLLNPLLRLCILDIGVRRCDLRLGLLKSRLVVAIIDAGDYLAARYVLVVGDRDGRNIAGYPRGDGILTRGDEGIVGALIMRGVVPVEKGRHRRCGKCASADQEHPPAPGGAANRILTTGIIRLRRLVFVEG